MGNYNFMLGYFMVLCITLQLNERVISKIYDTLYRPENLNYNSNPDFKKANANWF